MKISAVTSAMLLLVLTALSVPAFASYPILTSASGTFSESGSCTGSGSYTDSGSFTMTFSDQTGPDDFEFTVTVTGGDGQVLTSATNGGSFTSATSFTFQASDDTDTINVTVNIVDGSSFSASYTGSGGGCSWSGSASGSFNTAIVAPLAAAPNEIISNTETLNQVVSTFTTTLNTRIQEAFHGRAGLKRLASGVLLDSGMNAGDDSSSITGVWGSYSRSNFENDFYRTAYDGDRSIFMGGVDFAPSKDVIVGVALGWENTDVDTAFGDYVAGVLQINSGTADSNGYTIAPYVGIVLDETWNIDISGGFSSIDTDQVRNLGTATPVTSDLDTNRYFASININGYKQVDRWFLTGRIGAVHAQSKDDQYTESNGTVVFERTSKLSQLQLGGEAAYELGDWEPYIGGAYNYDMTSTDLVLTGNGPQPGNDHSDFLLSTGVRFYSKEGLTMSLGYDKRFGREDYDEETVTFNARWDF